MAKNKQPSVPKPKPKPKSKAVKPKPKAKAVKAKSKPKVKPKSSGKRKAKTPSSMTTTTSSLSPPPPGSLDSSLPTARTVKLAKNVKRKRQQNRMRIDLDDDGSGDEPSSSLTSPPTSSDDDENDRGGRGRGGAAGGNQDRQPRRFPANPNEDVVAEWLQSTTANPYVKLTRKQMKRMRPCSRIYLKVAKLHPQNGRIQKLLPGGVLVRNEFPIYCMLQGINNPKPFSMQFAACHFYIRRLDIPKITEEYEKNKIYQAVLEQQQQGG